jgi:transcription antitermination factor NusG
MLTAHDNAYVLANCRGDGRPPRHRDHGIDLCASVVGERFDPQAVVAAKNLLLGLPAAADNAAMQTEQPSNRFGRDDRVRINDSVFKDYVGVVDNVYELYGRVVVIVPIFGRPTPVELERWQIEPA